jgi:hypothetical protein
VLNITPPILNRLSNRLLGCSWLGSQWWTSYQPVSYTLTSKRGNRAQFANMVTACHNAGVKVVVGALKYATRSATALALLTVLSQIRFGTTWPVLTVVPESVGAVRIQQPRQGQVDKFPPAAFTHYNYPGIYQTQVRPPSYPWLDLH